MTPGTEDQFVQRVLETIERYDLLPRRPARQGGCETVVVAVSGGPDSVALLHVLHRLVSQEKLAIALAVAHLHHGLREGTADEDEVFVRNLAARLGLVCETGRADVRAEAEASGLGIEEAARVARRRFLTATARRHKARKVALAHHGGDRVETVLFHIVRGTGIDGLATLGARAPLAPEEHIEIVRPMMHPDLDRGCIETYLRCVGQDWRRDETNDDLAYTRNRLRNEVLPLLARTINPGVEAAILRLADQAEAAGEVLRDVLDNVWRQIVRETPPTTAGQAGRATRAGPDASEPDAPASGHLPRRGPQAILIDADDFESLRPWLQGAIVRQAVEHLGGGLKHMSAERTRAAVEALLAKTVAGPVDLPGGLVAERRRRAIRIGRRKGTEPQS